MKNCIDYIFWHSHSSNINKQRTSYHQIRRKSIFDINFKIGYTDEQLENFFEYQRFELLNGKIEYVLKLLLEIKKGSIEKMKYSEIHIFDMVFNSNKCYLREATTVFEPVRDRRTSITMKGRECVVGYSFIESFKDCIKEINRKYDFDIIKVEI